MSDESEAAWAPYRERYRITRGLSELFAMQTHFNWGWDAGRASRDDEVTQLVASIEEIGRRLVTGLDAPIPGTFEDNNRQAFLHVEAVLAGRASPLAFVTGRLLAAVARADAAEAVIAEVEKAVESRYPTNEKPSDWTDFAKTLAYALDPIRAALPPAVSHPEPTEEER